MPSLAERLRKTTAGQLRYGQARRIVQARRREIAEALKEGFAIKDIWRQLAHEEALSIQYRAFCKQVRRLIQDNRDMQAVVTPGNVSRDGPDRARENVGKAAADRSARSEDRTPLQVPDKPRPTFKWNPRPKKEDLI